jgi:hypothetical protein
MRDIVTAARVRLPRWKHALAQEAPGGYRPPGVPPDSISPFSSSTYVRLVLTLVTTPRYRNPTDLSAADIYNTTLDETIQGCSTAQVWVIHRATRTAVKRLLAAQ